MLEIESAWELIRGNDNLVNSISLPPLGQGQGGSAPVFANEDFITALRNGDEYTCVGEFQMDQLAIHKLPWGSCSVIVGHRLRQEQLFRQQGL